MAVSQPKRVAVIGGGAAGLVVGRMLRDADVQVQILEKSDSVGGVWKYRLKDVIYQSLVTNLPKEIMSYLDTPFDPSFPSFLRHDDVQAYLEDYAATHKLESVLSLNSEVKAVIPILRQSSSSSSSIPPGDYTVYTNEDNKLEDEEEDAEPMWEVTYASPSSKDPITKTFDAVVVCSGHYDVPFIPPLKDFEKYKGQVIHSRNYDSPQGLEGRKVLCVGYRASGTDVAREISQVAGEVHVVDRRLTPEQVKGIGYEQVDNIYRRPNLARFLGDGRSVEFEDGSIVEIDAVVLCTGYCYNMPFLEGGIEGKDWKEDNKERVVSGKGARLLRIKDRAVHPTYLHLFHAYWPSLSFMGLLHSVVPFPMFDLQAKWISEVILGNTKLSSRKERFTWIEAEKARQRELGKRPRDWHHMGVAQWDYFRLLARSTGILTPDVDRSLTLRKEIYDDVHHIRPTFPGGDDSYRRYQYHMDEASGTWTVEKSPIPSLEEERIRAAAAESTAPPPPATKELIDSSTASAS